MAKQSKRHMGQKVYSTEGVDSINVDTTGAVTVGASGFTGTHTLRGNKIALSNGQIRQSPGATVNNGAAFTTTFPLNVDGGGGLLIVSGYNPADGSPFTWIGYAAIQVAGGGGSVAGAAIASNNATFTVGSSGGFVALINGSGAQRVITAALLIGA
jgi:hypothetical protein